MRRPRKVFLLIGSVAAAILAVGLFTSLGTSHTTASQVGGPAPDFSLPTVAGTGRVGTPGSGGGHGTPAVLLFFGSWCSVCHSELPPLAATVRKQQQAHGALSRIAVIGVDSYDTRSTAGSFLRASGVTFPVALDSVAQVTNGLYAFTGDPETVFISGDGTISAIKLGPLSPAAFVSFERRLLAGP